MYKKIMVPLDGSKLAESVLPHLESLVKEGGQGEVVVVRVVEPYNFRIMSGEELPKAEDLLRFDAQARAAAEKYVQAVVEGVKVNGVNVRGEVLVGRPSVKLAEYADSGGFDLVVLATHGRSGVSRWVWGSVADRLLRAVCVPILMIRAPGCAPGILFRFSPHRGQGDRRRKKRMRNPFFRWQEETAVKSPARNR